MSAVNRLFYVLLERSALAQRRGEAVGIAQPRLSRAAFITPRREGADKGA
jgi:hypothetical protein